MVINKTYSIPTFGSRITYEDSKVPLTPAEKDYIDRFEEGRVYDKKFLGSGVTSDAYYSLSRGFVIKQNKHNPYIDPKTRYEMGSLAHENTMLLKIDPKVKTTQKGIAYVETEKGSKFLISSFVEGKPADKRTSPFTPKHIDRLLRNLYRLDKSMIIHSDLSRPNLLLDAEKNVNLIDYQWADTYSFSTYSNNYGLRNSHFPVFESPNNASMFESAGLAGYVRPMPVSESNDFLRNYYKNKAHYIEKNVHRLETNTGETIWNRADKIEFEKARLKAYQFMDEYILKAETLKMNILNLHRRQFSCYDTNQIEPRNILRTIPLMIRAKESADALATFSEGYDGDKTYFSYMRKYGEFWQRNISDWYPAALKWIFKIISGEINEKGRIIFPSKFDDFNNLDLVRATYSNPHVEKFSAEDLQLRKLFKSAYFWKHSSIFCKRDEAFRLIERVFRR